ncbi:hypothetical protein Y032_0013g2069 [Ancylostoma ceylanicum]|uniref:Uncharacterized protein n=1 Tax=Ancylostoma ceylanicum TaxID=53326 RepID=A0A016VBA5_9BILA|nr:hypothetical protein Y032_0013g2069 [Ancylostoma ceylanicum]
MLLVKYSTWHCRPSTTTILLLPIANIVVIQNTNIVVIQNNECKFRNQPLYSMRDAIHFFFLDVGQPATAWWWIPLHNQYASKPLPNESWRRKVLHAEYIDRPEVRRR